MPTDAHAKAVSYLLKGCQKMHIMSILAYGSYARGDYRPDSDIDLMVVFDSRRYSSEDLRNIIEICRTCREKFKVSFQMDIWVDSEIDLWNRGILLEGHSFIDLYFYRKDGKVLFGTDARDRFKLPLDLEEKARVLLDVIEAEFKRWFSEGEGQRQFVPHWMTGWLLATFLNTLGIVDVTSFNETCEYIEKIPAIAVRKEFEKYKRKEELTPNEFINLQRIMKNHTQKRQTS